MVHEAIRARVEAELASLEARLGKINAHLRNEDRELSADSVDQATQLENDVVVGGLDEVARRRLVELRAALDRMNNRTYGVCLDCGDDIDLRRLEAVPTAVFCIECATNH